MKAAWLPIALLCAAIVLGGSGSSGPLYELALQLFFAAALLAMATYMAVMRTAENVRTPGIDPSRSAIRPARLIAALVLILPLCQLIPLPPGVWQSFPGREAERAALALVGAENEWLPWSMAPSRTLASLLAMIPPVILLLLVARLDLQGRYTVLAGAAAIVLLSVVLGALQLADGKGGHWRLHSYTHLTYLTGFQANRNAQADVLQIGMLATAALIAGLGSFISSNAWKAMLATAWALMLLATLLTGSRMGIVLIAVSVPVSLAIVWSEVKAPLQRIDRRWLLAGVVAILVTGALVMQVVAVDRILERFAIADITRRELWQDTSHAIGQVMPFGSGIGTFIPVFLASESLEFVNMSIPVRAHNDWMEFVLEAGLPGIVVMLAILAVLVHAVFSRIRTWRIVRPGAMERGQLLCGAGSLVIIAAHATVDYPLRSMSLACLAAVAAAIMLPTSSIAGHSGAGPKR